ncbi:MAG: 4-hydroxy-tetrahydrodipicolinate reductase [Spirochaetota bacterium]
MRVAIVGYGRMGREIEQVLRSRGHEAALLVDPAFEPGTGTASAAGSSGSAAGGSPGPRFERELSARALEGCDVAIEFSLADAVTTNVEHYAAAGVPVVIGTTGWLAELPAIEERVRQAGSALVYGSNFSIGANLFFRLAKHAGTLVREIEEYDLMIHEVHHRGKKDSPSGTALTLAEAVLDAVPRKKRIETARLDRAPEPEELHVSSTRGGSVPGTHTLFLDSDADTIEVRHQARSRGGFALGAVRAAEWIVNRQGVFTVEQFINDLLEGR